MVENVTELGEYLKDKNKTLDLEFSCLNNELTVEVDKSNLIKFVTFLRDDPHCLFKVMVDLCGVDYLERVQRFEVVYHFLSLKYNMRIRLKVLTDEHTPVPSIVPLYSAAGWWEREAWDMYGIQFEGNPDLRRLLTDYGFEGHPLRKDFPQTGYVEVRYDEEQQRVLYEPVKLRQAYRTFDFLSPWEGQLNDMFGDDVKANAEQKKAS